MMTKTRRTKVDRRGPEIRGHHETASDFRSYDDCAK